MGADNSSNERGYWGREHKGVGVANLLALLNLQSAREARGRVLGTPMAARDQRKRNKGDVEEC